MFQIIELLFFGFIAVALISKLLSILGIVDDDRPKDARVTEVFSSPITDQGDLSKSSSIQNIGLIKEIEDRTIGFNIKNFLDKAKDVFNLMTNKQTRDENHNNLGYLIHKNSMANIMERIEGYTSTPRDMESKVIKADKFGNFYMLTVEFKFNNSKELWTFGKNLNDEDPVWYLTEINHS